MTASKNKTFFLFSFILIMVLTIKQMNEKTGMGLPKWWLAQMWPSRNSSQQIKSQRTYEHIPHYAKNVFKKSDGVFMFHDLCIEPAEGGVNLVSYNNNQSKTETITVKTGPHYQKNPAKWTIHLTTQRRPKTGIDLTSAFFITTTCEGNYHHFWKDSTWGLYGAMKATGMLGSPNSSQLYYHSDIWKFDRRTGCHGADKYQDILYALPVQKEHIYYKDAKPHSCYDNAVFGFYHKGFSIDGQREHFKKAFPVNCPPHTKTRVTIIQRNIRRILNAEELQKAAVDAGFDAKVVNLGHLKIKEQFAVMACTDILVGVQGAGLRWMDFLPKKSSVLELTWKHWGSFFAGQARGQQRKVTTFAAYKVELNLTAYFRIVKIQPHKNITKELVAAYEKKGPANEFDNHWKHGNGAFDAKIFVNKLKSITP